MACNDQQLAQLADDFTACRDKLRRIASLRIPPALSARISPDDLVQETYLAALHRMEHYFAAPEIPPLIRFRTLLLQTAIDLQRRHLQAQKRSANCEIPFDAPGDNGDSSPLQNHWNFLADTITSPRTQLARHDQYALLHQVLTALPEIDRTIIELRNFENLSNQECAAALQIDCKAASIRYVRALRRFREQLLNFTEFKS